ncbi:MAG: hypothetical protein HYX74_04405, partial [Acidobacteria bacterium]|nr:hypothetical protein [Acidobacteriota bacterium]
ALVRSATIVVDSPAAHGNHETVLSIWQPGEPPPPVPGGVVFKLPADAHLRVQIRYKKPWYVHGAMSDQSAVGLYFAEQPAFGQALKALPVRAAPSGYTGPRRFTCDVPGDIKVLAVIPHLDQPYAAIDIQGLLPDGSRVRLLHLAHPRPEWDRRYWLAHPIDLPEGAQLEATAIVEPLDSDVPLRAAAGTRELQLTVNFVSR